MTSSDTDPSRESCSAAGMRLAVVMVNYRNPEDTLACLRSLAESDPERELSCYVVENGSRDGSDSLLASRLAAPGDLPRSILKASPENLGFTGGTNLGVRCALEDGATHIAVLNNDTEVDSGFTAAWKQALNRHPSSLLAGRIREFASERASHNVGKISPWTWIVRFDFSEHPNPSRLDFASFCFLSVPAEVFRRVGLLREDFFLYCEDVEFCLRCRRVGVPLRFAPGISLRHKVSRSVDGSGTAKEYYRFRNQTRLILESGNPLRQAAYALRILPVLLRRGLFGPLAPQFRAGLRDAWAGRMGKRAEPPPSLVFNALMLQNHLGGIGNYAYHLLQALRAARPEWRLSLLTHAGVAPSFAGLEGVRTIALRIQSRIGRLLWLHLIAPWTFRRADLLHSIGNMGVPLALSPQAITVHDTYEQVSPERFSARKRFFMKLLVRISGSRARVILADSRNTLNDIGRFYPSLASKSVHVPLGTKYAERDPGPHDGRSGILFVGTIEPGKNLPLLLRAYALGAAAHSHPLRIAGAKGWESSDLPALAASLGIAERVEWLGYVGEGALEKLYRSSLALVMASNYEGYGLPALEAASLGCLPVLARNSSLTEAGGDGALYFETGDENGLAECLARLVSDADLRADLRRKGLAHARHYTWARTAEETAAAFEAALGWRRSVPEGKR